MQDSSGPMPIDLLAQRRESRRSFLRRTSGGLGVAALSQLLSGSGGAQARSARSSTIVPRAKRVIFLYQSGAPSQVDLFDAKPGLRELHGKELPDSIRRGQRLTTMTSVQSSHPITAPAFAFQKYGDSGAEIGRAHV